MASLASRPLWLWLWLGLGGCVRHVRSSGEGDKPVVVERWTMGTRLRIVAHGAHAADGARAAADEIDRLDALLSDWRDDSALTAINRRAGEAVAAPDDVCRFVRAALDGSRRTDGAFDITVRPLSVALRAGSPPEALARARAFVGWRDVEVRELGEARPADPGTGTARSAAGPMDEGRSAPARSPLAGCSVRLARRGMGLDPGGLGKGWAVDAAVAVLRARGVTSAFVDFGESSFYGLGSPPGPGAAAWNVQVRDAAGGPGGPVVALRDRALSTSMSLPIPEAPGDEPRPHIVDPRTGEPIRVARIAAAAAPSCADTEILGKALIVGGAAAVTVADRFPGAGVWIQEAGGATGTRGRF